ncbi:MAG: hypothetical protein QOH76_2438 [Thermoleophilaceae bacterium]|nr:hypothetical protein [Thermoleophilaceae bacterium]
MAVGVILDFEGGTLDQYDQVIGRMGFTPGGEGAPGGLFHWVTKTDDGIRVTDVWESPEQFQAFAEEKIGPITQEMGLPEPRVTIQEAHNYLTAG